MKPNLQTAIRTLVSGGFHLETVERNPGYAILFTNRLDEFGVTQRYGFVLAEEGLGKAQVETAKVAAEHHDANLVVVASTAVGHDYIGWPRFVSLFGGPVFSATPLEINFRGRLHQLGHNKLPEGLDGRPDDLFEAYVQVALEFIMWDRVIRYGQERRFEARPDGLVLKSDFVALYDAKAAGKGYDVSLDTIRQFSSYIEDFKRRYNAFLPEMSAFIVISGHFQQESDTLADRSRDLQAKCGVPLTFLTTDSLGEIIEILKEQPTFRGAIPWRRVFIDPVVDSTRVRRELEAIEKDRIVPLRHKRTEG